MVIRPDLFAYAFRSTTVTELDHYENSLLTSSEFKNSGTKLKSLLVDQVPKKVVDFMAKSTKPTQVSIVLSQKLNYYLGRFLRAFSGYWRADWESSRST